MAIRKIDINIGTVPAWGDEDFDANVHENFTSLKNIVPRINDTVKDIDTVAKLLNDKIEEVASNAQEVSENLLITKAASNYQGIWQGKGYATGQSVKGSNGVIYQCDVTHTTAQNPTTTTGYWSVNIPLGAVGNIMSPLLDLPLKNSLTMKAGVGSTTFTRASTATYIDRYGVLKTAGIDAPRFEKEGYLNEGSSTNLVTNSNVFTHPEWGNASNTLVGGYPSPDGANNATLVTTINTDSCAIFKSVVFSAKTATISIFAKAGTSSSLILRFVNYDLALPCQFNLADKTVSHANGKIIELSNGWFRCSLSITFTGTDLDGTVYCYTATNAGANYTSNIGNSMYIYGFQAESLPFASSYIPTTSSTVTRSADVLQVTRENNFPNAENNKEGYSVAFAYDSLGIRPSNQFLWSIYVNGQNYDSGFLQIASNSLRNAIAKDGVGLSNSTTPVNPLGSNKVVQTQSNTFLKQYINGTLVNTDVNTLGILAVGTNSLTNITVGGISGISTANLFGHISDFKVYDRELTPVEVALL